MSGVSTSSCKRRPVERAPQLTGGWLSHTPQAFQLRSEVVRLFSFPPTPASHGVTVSGFFSFLHEQIGNQKKIRLQIQGVWKLDQHVEKQRPGPNMCRDMKKHLRHLVQMPFLLFPGWFMLQKRVQTTHSGGVWHESALGSLHCLLLVYLEFIVLIPFLLNDSKTQVGLTPLPGENHYSMSILQSLPLPVPPSCLCGYALSLSLKTPVVRHRTHPWARSTSSLKS